MSDTTKYKKLTKAEQLAQLQTELTGYKTALSKAADTITENNISEYPVFVFHQHTVDIGIPIIDREETKGNWSVNASSLEELSTKQIIQPDKVTEFIQLITEHGSDLCLFVLSELGANFIFLPRA